VSEKDNNNKIRLFDNNTRIICIVALVCIALTSGAFFSIVQTGYSVGRTISSKGDGSAEESSKNANDKNAEESSKNANDKNAEESSKNANDKNATDNNNNDNNLNILGPHPEPTPSTPAPAIPSPHPEPTPSTPAPAIPSPHPEPTPSTPAPAIPFHVN
jgi:hypothetical protein